MLRVISSPLFHFFICKTKIMVLAPGVQCSEVINENSVENLDTVTLTTQVSLLNTEMIVMGGFFSLFDLISSEGLV